MNKKRRDEDLPNPVWEYIQQHALYGYTGIYNDGIP